MFVSLFRWGFFAVIASCLFLFQYRSPHLLWRSRSLHLPHPISITPSSLSRLKDESVLFHRRSSKNERTIEKEKKSKMNSKTISPWTLSIYQRNVLDQCLKYVILLSEKTKLLVLMSQSLPLSAQKSPMSRSGAAPVGSSTSLWPQAIWLWWSDQTRLPQEG
ncbi:hypothetical protein Bca101_084990 [Brassica carinata]